MNILKGGHNFRDIGGYAAAGGKRVRRGLVFRSGMMTSVDDHDLARLRETGLSLIFDLRSAAEREKYPTPWREIGAQEYRFDDSIARTGDLYRLIESGGGSAEETRQAMLNVYRDLVFDHAAIYGTILYEIANGSLPLAFHCAAGKDRTGVLTALLLSSLGVSYDVVKADYILTNERIDLMAMVLRQREAKDGPVTGINALPLEALVPLLRAESEYLDAAFAEIETRCGTLATYFSEVLRLSDDDQNLLRLRLLEDDNEL
jgi:protein-tyrosine phosphatase